MFMLAYRRQGSICGRKPYLILLQEVLEVAEAGRRTQLRLGGVTLDNGSIRPTNNSRRNKGSRKRQGREKGEESAHLETIVSSRHGNGFSHVYSTQDQRTILSCRKSNPSLPLYNSYLASKAKWDLHQIGLWRRIPIQLAAI